MEDYESIRAIILKGERENWV